MIADRAARLEKLRREQAADEVAEVQAPTISAKSKQIAQHRSVHDMMEWESQRVAKIMARREEQERSERGAYSFQPSVTAKSKVLFAKSGRHTDEPVEMRLLRTHDERKEKERREKEQSERIMEESIRSSFR